jgi:pimeloyl-ACP methyl ester carboxylesterase
VLSLGQGSPCRDRYGSSFEETINNTTYPSLVKALKTARSRAPHARVAILGYPWIMPPTGGCFEKMPIAEGDVPYVKSYELQRRGIIEVKGRADDDLSADRTTTIKLPRDELGEGPALLLLHAGIANRQMWAEHLEPLAATGHRVVAVDLPGFGEAASPRGPVAHWEDVLETMDALGVERPALVGNSFGASVALRLAALRPDRVSSLLLFSAGAVPDPEPSAELLAAWEAEENALEAGDVGRAAEAVATAWVRPEAPEGVRQRVIEMQLGNYERHRSEQEPEQAPDPLEGDPGLLAGITCPALIAAGELDLVDFRDAVDDLGAKLPEATTALISGCGHLAPLEAPQEFQGLVLENLGPRNR